MAINILDSMIINRISAGEVVESPFSIVKELIDNSLDAGATKITVEIKNGGIDEIIIKDNGKGIEHEDLIKAFLPHATSKIKSIDDLYEIATLGFRGEALASISNVARTSVLTKTSNSDCAYYLEVNGGEFGEIEPSTCDVGTTFKVKDLFFNTPARRKFLRKPKQEENQITNIVARYILAHPSVSFKYIVNDKVVYNSRGGDLINAIFCIYGNELSQNIVEINGEIENIKLSGFVSKVGYSKPNTTYQTLMINGRYVIDDIVSKAIYMAFEEYLMPRQFPVYILNLTIPMLDVDVNVHPSKMMVKFSNPNRVYELVYSAARRSIYKFLNPPDNPEEFKFDEPQNSLIKTDFTSLNEISIEPNFVPSTPSSSIVFKQTEFKPITIFDEPAQQKDIETVNNPEKTTYEIYEKQKSSTANEQAYQSVQDLAQYKIVGEIFKEFIILEKDENMLLLDFHAGHERLNYDKFVKMVENKDIAIQNLLVPYVHEMTEQEVEYVLNLKPELEKLGFDIDSFGDKKVIVNAIPVQLKDINIKNFIEDLLHDMKNIKPQLNNELNHYLMKKACKSSVKSGMTLSEMEIKELLKNLDFEKPVLLCPHGRPILTVVKKSQIEKWFKRIVWWKKLL